MTFVSIVILIGYILLHVFSIIQTDRCLIAHTRKDGLYKVIRPVWILVYVILSLLPVAGTFWPDSPLKYSIMKVGNLTLGFDIYYCGFLLIFTIVQAVLNWVKNKKPDSVPPKAKWMMIASIILAIIFPVYGMIHAQRPVATYWTADATGGQEAQGEYRVVLLGDLHMSVNSDPQLIEKAVTLANAQDADAVFIAGDFFTSNYEGLKDPEKYSDALSKLSAREGVFAVYGNHDVKENLFCGFAVTPVSKAFRPSEMVQFMRECGFRILEDEIIEIAGGKLVLAGRIDADKAGDGTNDRKSAEELLAGVDPDKTILVLEHEPKEYKDLLNSGVEVVFSGHTHNGQIWPCNIFVPLMTRNAYGQKNIRGMETFVTSGVGYFGPPQRSGTISEVMVIDIVY